MTKTTTKRREKKSAKVSAETKSTDTLNLPVIDEKDLREEEKSKNKKLSADSKAELRLLYALVVSDIKLVKEQQWRIISYVIGAYITIYGIWKTAIPGERKYLLSFEFWLILIFGIVICGTGSWLINIEQNLLKRSRCRIDNIKAKFTLTFAEVFYENVKPDISSFEKKANYYLQQSIIILGFIFLIYAVSWN